MSNILERIKQISENENIKIGLLESKIGASKGVLSRAIKNKTDIQSKWIIKIIENYPNYNANWLLTGKGKMLKQENKQDPSYLVKERSLNYKQEIPLIPIDAMASFGEDSMQIMSYDMERYKVPEFTELNVDFMIRVKGSSMYPKYNNGDLVACKKLSINNLFFQWNKVYVLETEQGALIKRIKKSDIDNSIKIVSDNPNYDTFDIPLNKIYAISLVVGVIQLE